MNWRFHLYGAKPTLYMQAVFCWTRTFLNAHAVISCGLDPLPNSYAQFSKGSGPALNNGRGLLYLGVALDIELIWSLGTYSSVWS